MPQTAASDLSKAQVHTFDLGSVDEDFAEGAGIGKAIEMLRIKLEGQHFARLPRQTQSYVERASALHDAYLGDVAEVWAERVPAAL